MNKDIEIQRILSEAYELEPELSKHMRKFFADGIKVNEEPTKVPDWAFWRIEGLDINGFPRIAISASKYLEFLDKASYRVFPKKGQPTVVLETVDGMERTKVRGRLNTSVKEYVCTYLHGKGYEHVIDAMLVNTKFFTLDILEQLPEITQEKARKSIFSELDTRIRFSTPIEDEVSLITYQGDEWESTLLTTDNFMGVSGFSGSGKTNFVELLASLAISPDCEALSPIRLTIHGGKVLWYDTERSTGDCVRSLRRIKQRVGAWRHENKNMLTEDGDGFERLEIVAVKGIEDQNEYILEHLDAIDDKVSLVILDGALDLVTSMNAEEEAKMFTNNLMRITKKLGCGVVVTVHGKTSKDDTGSGMGHVGKAIERKCCAFLMVQTQATEDGRDIKRVTTEFSAGKVRNGRVSGVDAFFEWDEDDGMSHFIEYDIPDRPKKETTRQKIEKAIQEIYKNHSTLRYKELINLYVQVTGLSIDTAKKHIRSAKSTGLVGKDGSRYILNSAF